MSFFSCFQGSVVAAEHLEIILENLLKVLLDSASRLGDSLYPPSPMYIYHKLTHNKLSKSPENPQLAQREVVSSTDSLHLQTAESIPVQSIAPQARPLLAIQRAYGRQRPPLQCLQPPQQPWPQPPPALARRRRRRPRRRAPCPQPPASPPPGAPAAFSCQPASGRLGLPHLADGPTSRVAARASVCREVRRRGVLSRPRARAGVAAQPRARKRSGPRLGFALARILHALIRASLRSP